MPVLALAAEPVGTRSAAEELDAELNAQVSSKARAQLLRRFIRIDRQQQHAIGTADIRAIDARVCHHVAELVPHDQNIRLGAQHLRRFGQHQLDEPGILAGDRRQARSFIGHLDAIQIDITVFRFGNGFLRDDEHVVRTEL